MHIMVVMMKSIFKILTAGVFVMSVAALDRAHAFGDEPRWPGFGYSYEPAIASGCWKWNWQQYSWYDHCPVYVRPKAYMYPRSSYRTVLRAKS